MSISIKKFREDYKMYKRILSHVKQGMISFEQIVEQFVDRFNGIDDFICSVTNIVRQYEASIYIIYNANGTVNRKEFYKFYERFIKADEDQKKVYERVNVTSYNEMLRRLNGIKEDLENAEKIRQDISALNKRIRDIKEIKKELIDLGIAEDDNEWNIIRIKPEKFVEYLEYLEKHRDMKI